MKSQQKHSGGRPTVMTEEILRKLDQAFSNGATDIEACFLANISTTSLYDYQKEHLEFTERKQGLKDMTKYQAKVNIKERIERKDVKVSMWYLERKAREFSPNQTVNITSEPVELWSMEQATKILAAL